MPSNSTNGEIKFIPEITQILIHNDRVYGLGKDSKVYVWSPKDENWLIVKLTGDESPTA